MKCLYSINCKFDYKTFNEIVRNGNLESMRWLNQLVVLLITKHLILLLKMGFKNHKMVVFK